jgi:soluble lytic murein transglycosylase-like protein
MKKRPLIDRVSIQLAKLKKGAAGKPLIRLVGGRGAATLALGAALSVGGLTDVLSSGHLLVRKELDSVRIVRQNGEKQTVVASMGDGFAGNTLFKLSRALPDRYVTRELALFDGQWLPDTVAATGTHAPQRRRDVFFEEVRRFNYVVRRDFFTAAMPYGDLIHEKAEKYDVDPVLVAAVIEQESRFRTRARSQVGAKGLMQLMPRTGRWMGASDLYDPEQNIDAGVKYIKYLQQRFNGNMKKTLAAYNAGEGNVKRYGGVPPFRETQHYVKRVMKNYNKRNAELKEFEQDQLRGGTAISDTDGTLTIR